MSALSDFFTKSKNQRKLEAKVESLNKEIDGLETKVVDLNCEIKRLLLENKSLKQINESLFLENKKLKESHDNANVFVNNIFDETESFLKGKGA